MSLKAKIEAVIYAAEEPVTLVQLVGLLGEEGQQELDALLSRQSSFDLDGPDSAEPEAAEPQSPESSTGRETEALADDVSDIADNSPEPAAEAEATPETEPDEKSLAREASAAAKLRERALRDYFRELLESLIADYANGDRGLEIREVAGGFRLATKPEYHDAVRGFVKALKPPMKLTLQALETLAVVAYKQPVTAPEVSEIRGVDSAGVLGGLITRKLVTTAGRKQVIGRPILYKTTKDFLVRFGLKDIAELPSIEEFEKMAGELADADPVQEEIPMETSLNELDLPSPATNFLHETPEDLMSDRPDGMDGHRAEPTAERSSAVEPMADVHEAQADGVPDEPATESPADPTSDFDPKTGGA